jgi:hypothetical protein
LIPTGVKKCCACHARHAACDVDTNGALASLLLLLLLL